MNLTTPIQPSTLWSQVGISLVSNSFHHCHWLPTKACSGFSSEPVYMWSGFWPICTCWWYSGSNFTHATHVQGNCSCINPFCASHSLTLNASLAEAITFSIDLFIPALILLALPLIHNHNLLKGLSRATQPELDGWPEHLKNMPCLIWPQLYSLLPRCLKSTNWTRCIWSLCHFLYMPFQVLGLCYSWKDYRLRSNYSWDYITSKKYTSDQRRPNVHAWNQRTSSL